jgi:translation initiation factor 2-alpha kinase 4
LKESFEFVSKDLDGNITGIFDREANFRIFSDMVNGLVEIHKNDVIHRDLKPENIFIDDSKQESLPTAKIGDFGLARMLKNERNMERLNSLEQN